jgi:hypothetical protein
LGDVNGIQTVPQRFVDNLFNFMLDGGALVTACPPPTIESLISQVTDLYLSDGEKNSLVRKLTAALASLAKMNANATINQLDAFVSEVHALFTSGRLDEASVDELIARAEEIINSI